VKKQLKIVVPLVFQRVGGMSEANKLLIFQTIVTFKKMKFGTLISPKDPQKN